MNLCLTSCVTLSLTPSRPQELDWCSISSVAVKDILLLLFKMLLGPTTPTLSQYLDDELLPKQLTHVH